eukprot:NODE_349_length_8994_cov_1.235526.p7 type:complete len:197 gc:universal NODE_349_length_8994_cov_1.235526:5838-5248(-)
MMTILQQFLEKWIYNILHLRKVYPYHSFSRELAHNTHIAIPKLESLKKYIGEMLIGINFDDVEEISVILIQDNKPFEKHSVRIFNYDGRVSEDEFWHQCRGIFIKLYSIDAAIGEAVELSEKEYLEGKRSFYIVAHTDGRYPCSELDDWVPAENREIRFELPSLAIPVRTVENSAFKLETFAMIPDNQDIIPDSQE